MSSKSLVAPSTRTARPKTRRVDAASDARREKPDAELLLPIDADFSAPRSKELLAAEQRRFTASVGPFYDIELPEED
jgi:hypothetical protein